MNILAARRMLLSGETRIQYMHIKMHCYIRNILALFNEKYFSLITHYIDIFCCISVCHPCGFICLLYKTFTLTRKIVIGATICAQSSATRLRLNEIFS